MTEAEAKGKYCQQFFAENTIRNCSGSKCMAWRWEREDTGSNASGYGTKSSTTYGFCGLAGRP